MILNLRLYSKVTRLRTLWNQRQMKKLSGEKVFKSFRLHRTEWPSKIYFYSPRLKRIPHFTGNVEILKSWRDSKLAEKACPTMAIKVTDYDFFIDPKGCITCGICVEMAPEGLLEVVTELRK